MPSLFRPDGNFVRINALGKGIRCYGSSSGYVGLKPAANAGSIDFTLPSSTPASVGILSSNSFGVLSFVNQVGLFNGGTNADLTTTGGTSRVLRQSSVGAAITVSQLASTDISGLGTAATQNTGTSGATIPLLNAANTWSGQNTFAAGSITTNQPFTISQTWNASGVTFNGLLVDITSTASAAASLPVNVKVGGNPIFTVDKSGVTTVFNNLGVSGNVNLQASSSVGWSGRGSITSDSSNNIVASAGIVSGGNIQCSTAAQIGFTNRGQFSSPAANWIQLGSADGPTANAQTLSVWSITGASNTSAPDWTFQNSLPTGTGTPGNQLYKTGFSGVIYSGTTVTISIGANATVTLASHGFSPGQPVVFTTTGALPTGITASTTYYVSPRGLGSGSFRLTTTALAASDVTTSGTQSGTHSVTTPAATVQSTALTAIAYGPVAINGSQSTGLINANQYWNTSGAPTAFNFGVWGLANNGARVFDFNLNGTSVFYSRFDGTTVLTNSGAYTIMLSGSGCSFTAATGNNAASHVFVSGNQVNTSGATVEDFRHTSAFVVATGSSKFIGMGLNYTCNQTGSASGDFSGLRVSLTKTGFLGTNSRLIEGQLVGTGVVFSVFDSGNIVSAGSIATADPSSGAGQPWLLGQVKAGAVTLDTANYVEVKINGVTKKLLVAA